MKFVRLAKIGFNVADTNL